MVVVVVWWLRRMRRILGKKSHTSAVIHRIRCGRTARITVADFYLRINFTKALRRLPLQWAGMSPKRTRSIHATVSEGASAPVDEPTVDASASSVEALGRLVRQQERFIEELIHERTTAARTNPLSGSSEHLTITDQAGGGSLWPLNRFMQLNPPVFSGTTDPMEANRWLMDVKKILTAFRCPEDQQVTFATFLLRGEAEEWWKATKRLMPNRPMREYITWKAFTDAFDQKYFPASLLVELTREFTQLKQGNMTVAQYEERFNTLSRFCPRVVPDDAARAEQFKMGLRIEIRKQVNMARNLTYAELVENAGIAERDLLEEYSQRQERVARRPGRLDGHP
ncbi:uncharacterized protein [Typha angustifolia]|uniref:uncharacterized protein n=1 Tax=Typha angustifolia TaxID=59011 RepID=UPI003C2C4502